MMVERGEKDVTDSINYRCSNGIGKACARVFARKGYDLVLVARHREKLEAVKAELSEYDVQIKVIAMDLTGEDAAVDLYII